MSIASFFFLFFSAAGIISLLDEEEPQLKVRHGAWKLQVSIHSLSRDDKRCIFKCSDEVWFYLLAQKL